MATSTMLSRGLEPWRRARLRRPIRRWWLLSSAGRASHRAPAPVPPLLAQWNRKMGAITGFSKEEVVGRSLVQDFISDEV